MKVLAINGSPRKAWNTAMLLNSALEGAASKGAKTELVHLYDLDFKGCTSCFSCKIKNGKSYGKCALKDDLTPILQKAAEADAIILGSPIYIGYVTGEMKSFLERLIYPYLVYDIERSSLFKKKIQTGVIYTLGAPEIRVKEMGYDSNFKMIEMLLARIFGSSESLAVYDTLQFDDYSKYVSSSFDPEQKVKRRKEVFPLDCQKAYDMGARFAKHR
jgi:multimeric flavodoxin WrbA